MRKLLFLLFVIAGTGYLLTQTACDKNDCEKTKLETEVKRSFMITGTIFFNDGVLYSGGPVKINVRKEYCEGMISGNNDFQLVTNRFGKFTVPTRFTYKFENQKDFVNVIFSFNFSDHKYEVVEKVFFNSETFKDVDYNNGDVNDVVYTIKINLPWLPQYPKKVILTSPDFLSDGHDLYTRLKWEEEDQKNSYDVMLHNIRVATNISRTSFDVETPKKNHFYFWHIISRNEYGMETHSDSSIFETAPEPPYFKDERDGTYYNVVQIGTQTWFAENLKYKTEWALWYKGADLFFWLNNYGMLYEWKDAIHACPQGWHLPSDDEWKTLEKFLGMSAHDADEFGYNRGTDEGKKLKIDKFNTWPPNSATDEVGFSAFPAGWYELNEDIDDINFYGFRMMTAWWTSTLQPKENENDPDIAYYRAIHTQTDRINREKAYDFDENEIGYSIRCVK